jgi:hypothetical protein
MTMRFAIFVMATLALVASATTGGPKPEEKKAMSVKKITPVLFAAEIEPCVKFWVERFGFEKTVEGRRRVDVSIVRQCRQGCASGYGAGGEKRADVSIRGGRKPG